MQTWHMWSVRWLLIASTSAVLASYDGDTDPTGAQHGVEAFVRCTSSTGEFTIHAKKAWAPIGYTRFMELTKDPEYWPGQLIYRNIPNFLAQFGVPADKDVTARWLQKPRLKDDPHLDRFTAGNFRPGLVSFAGGGPDSRTHHLFISTGASADFLGGADHETPFGTIEGGPNGEGFKNILKWYNGPQAAKAEREQHQYVMQGNAYMEPKYPELDRITGCTVVREVRPGETDKDHTDTWGDREL
eukprot:m.17253 g.17253  ORF g.17253 m.17253 type:complete len:243 (+) comp3474_c0_seq1:82-810(+)